MQRFEIRNVHAWQDWKADAALPIEVYHEYREAVIRLMADKPIRVYAQVEGEPRLCIATGSGVLEAVITVASDAVVFWEADKGVDAEVWWFPLTGSQLWEDEDGDGSFTVVEPRSAVEDDNYRRMMMLMQMNVQARVQAQIDAMKGADDAVIDDLRGQLAATGEKLAALQAASEAKE